jgi:uncharacterized protein YqiB (DUF1249 family)
MDGVKIGIQIIGPVIKTVETDVPTLQRLVKQNYQDYMRCIERLKKARAQRNVARAEATRLQRELDILLRKS